MGIVLAKFRKKKSTAEVLEEIQERIDELEKFTFNTQEQKKRCLSNFMAVSVGIYVLSFAVFYLFYSPTTWRDQAVYILPLLTFPFVIIVLRYVFSWYFERKLSKNTRKLQALRAEKKKILEQVMDKETYKVAVTLLARFGDPRAKVGSMMSINAQSSSMSGRALNTSSISTSRTPEVVGRPGLHRPDQPSSLAARPSLLANPSSAPTTQPPAVLQTSVLNSSITLSSATANSAVRRRTPFPVINPNDRGVFERVMDMLMGDGPQNRYAMICKSCCGHNGMALKEDFEYASFRCVYCDMMNTARKSRPIAPRLSMNQSHTQTFSHSSNSSSSESGDSDTTDVLTLPVNDLGDAADQSSMVSVVENPANTADNCSHYSDGDGLCNLSDREQGSPSKSQVIDVKPVVAEKNASGDGITPQDISSS